MRPPRRVPELREVLRREVLRRDVDFFRPPALRAPVLRAAGLRRVDVFRALVFRVERFRVEALRVVRRSSGMSDGIPMPVSSMPGSSPIGCIGISSVTSANLPVSSSNSSEHVVVWHIAFPRRAQVCARRDTY